MTSLVCVLTTIQEPTVCVRGLGEALDKLGSRVVVIGDKKGPSRFELPAADFFSLESQSKLPYKLAKLLPTGHYSRKNLGYLIAFSRDAGCIYETDDDNAPLAQWVPRLERAQVQPVQPRPWLNVYRLFKDELIWPRGFPLDRVRDPETYHHDARSALVDVIAPIQQGLANDAPDVDAIWRLILDHPVDFDAGPSAWLPPGTCCPFNSQSTWWWPDAYPLMYLPSFCSFRMTDIWRSFIAQRCVWELGCGLVFHGAEVYQLRNTHNLLRDFKDEVSGYLTNQEIVTRLNECRLLAGRENVGENLRRCYQTLIDARILPSEEMALVDAWLNDTSSAHSLKHA
jgi:hypothetical protein